MNGRDFSFAAAVKWAAAFFLAQLAAMPAVGWGLVGMVVMDYATGWAAAFVRQELSSEVGMRGLVKKAVILILPMAVATAESASGWRVNAAHAIAIGLITNELISIVENCQRAGAPIPPQIVQALLSVQKFRKVKR